MNKAKQAAAFILGILCAVVLWAALISIAVVALDIPANHAAASIGIGWFGKTFVDWVFK